MARDTLSEIEAKKLRFTLSHQFLAGHVEGLRRAWQNAQSNVVGHDDIFIIRMVTFLELSTRSWVQQLIDNNEKCAQHAIENNQKEKLTFSLAHAVLGKRLTLGEIFSHLISVSSVSDIILHMKIVLGSPVWDEIKTIHDRFDTEILGYPVAPVLKDYDATIAGVAKTFELRHIIVHELPAGLRDKRLYSREDMTEMFVAVETFIRAMDALVSREAFGNYALTQNDMNIEASEKFIAANKVLEELIGSERLKYNPGEVGDAHSAWLSYRDKYASYKSGHGRAGAGSISPMIYHQTMTGVTVSRIEQMDSYVDFGPEA